MAITTARIIRNYHRNDFFALRVDQNEIKTNILMELFSAPITTKNIPQTSPILKKYLPTILKSKCFNQNNYPFSKEVRNTEIGHLFEHILLEYLYEQKLKEGASNPVYNGLTQWNWQKDIRGVFHINVDVGLKERYIFQSALEKSIRLLNLIIPYK